ncbi:MAG TPA: ABC transporter ATP-binding protein [Candidatus Limnocylindrales bacterium]|nr:ABC transporter ATP-binding protein [Candidatus Limnocylindrales bacterium]
MTAVAAVAARASTIAPDRTPVALSIEGVRKRYGPPGNGVLALADITLEVRRGAFVCLVGASGCGKTTLLNLVAGLDAVDAGRIERRGRVGLLFQEAALFPWLTAAGNVELALGLRGVRRGERSARARDLLDLVNLGGFGDRRPHELSGGMRQRVALARALAQDADILLMDEPFGSLDAMTRDLLHEELERVWLDRGFTVLFVTHDVREAVRLGDEVVVLTSRPGRVAERFPIDLPRDRRGDAAALGAIATEITHRLRREVRRHGRDR